MKKVLFCFILIVFLVMLSKKAGAIEAEKSESGLLKSYVLYFDKRLRDISTLEGLNYYRIQNFDKKITDFESYIKNDYYQDNPDFVMRAFGKAGADLLNSFKLVQRINKFVKYYTNVQATISFDSENSVKTNSQIITPKIEVGFGEKETPKKENIFKIRLKISEKLSSVGVFQESRPLQPSLNFEYTRLSSFTLGIKTSIAEIRDSRTIVYFNPQKQFLGFGISSDYLIEEKQIGLFLNKLKENFGFTLRTSRQIANEENTAFFSFYFLF